ncbi:MAG: sulfatase [Bryobacteraceae bacterium]|nr:sulfatase [Bryobacteraceae bacterium]
MLRRTALQTLLAAAGTSAQRKERPNLVFVLVDDLRWNGLGCTGHPFAKTPNIDRLAKEGVLFRNAFVTTPLCSPARGSFLTGQYVRTHGVKGNGDNAALSHRLVTWPRLLHEAGYETGYAGKWHMGTDDSPRPGFDRWVSFKGQGVYENPPLNVDGQQVKRDGYMTDLLSDYAVEFLKKKRDKPFALYLAHKAVHGPFTPAPRHAALFTNETIQRAANARDSLEGKPMLRRRLEDVAPAKKKKGSPQSPGGPSDEIIKDQVRCMASIDEGVGRMLSTLEESKQLDRTLVVFTSDNGYLWGEHGLGDKRAAYEESIRIPLLARYPKMIRAGRVANEMALNIDIAPTMLEAAGVPVHRQMQGRSLLGPMSGKAKNWRKSFLCEYYMERQFARVATWEAVRTEQWKYIHYPELQDSDELYDLRADAGEMRNVIGSEAKALAECRRELERYGREIGPMG